MPATSSFADFSADPAYSALNKEFVERVVERRAPSSVVDLGCEAGVVTALIAAKLPKAATLLGVDPSAAALRIAERSLQKFDHVSTRFVRGTAEEIARFVKDPVDLVFFCNAIHLVPDKVRVVREIASVLKPGGAFAFSTAFFRGAEPEETLSFYRGWLFRALRCLRKTYNLTPHREKAPARMGLTVDEYRELLENAGLVPSALDVLTVDLSLNACRALTRFDDFVEGVLPGVPLEVASTVLEGTLADTFDALSMSALARNWLLVVAERN